MEMEVSIILNLKTVDAEVSVDLLRTKNLSRPEKIYQDLVHIISFLILDRR